MIRTVHIASLAVLGTALLTSGCGDSSKASNASTSQSKPAPATTSPVKTPPSASATQSPAAGTKAASEVKPLGDQTTPAGQIAEDLTKVVDSLPAVPSQDDVDAAAQKSITDANADSEFDKLSKEIDGDKP